MPLMSNNTYRMFKNTGLTDKETRRTSFHLNAHEMAKTTLFLNPRADPFYVYSIESSNVSASASVIQ